MNFAKEFFSDQMIQEEALLNYGFIKEKDDYIYTKRFLNDKFEVEIKITKDGDIKEKIVEIELGEEYLGLYSESYGKFAHQIQEEYKKILLDIVKKCCTKQYFLSKQANRITNWIIKKYGIKPIFPWKKLPRHGIFTKNDKTFASILNVQRKKQEDENFEEITFRANETLKTSLLLKKGVYHGYYKAIQNWISIVLDETFSDEEIQSYIQESYQIMTKPNSWIIPANPIYFDVISYLENHNQTTWRQIKGAKKGDFVYIYLAKPYSAILYQCQIINTNIPCRFELNGKTIAKAMEMKVFKKYDEKQYPFDKLKNYGVNFFRGPVKMPEKLEKEINKN